LSGGARPGAIGRGRPRRARAPAPSALAFEVELERPPVERNRSIGVPGRVERACAFEGSDRAVGREGGNELLDLGAKGFLVVLVDRRPEFVRAPVVVGRHCLFGHRVSAYGYTAEVSRSSRCSHLERHHHGYA
jgi:hypothetical protein